MTDDRRPSLARSRTSKLEKIPKQGEWPVDPQEDVPILQSRIWVDGCFDFAHHGHAGAILQARQLGTELLVGVHSDEAILENKGPTVMNLKERIVAVEACRWVTKAIPNAPYVTSLPWISHYGCQHVVHGDDITSDSGGEDCYRFVKAAGRFKVVKRTPGISTTDIVGRMLLCTKSHFIRSLDNVLTGSEGSGDESERKERGIQMTQRIRDYATDETGKAPGSEVWYWRASRQAKERRVSQSSSTDNYTSTSDRVRPEKGTFKKIVEGRPPRPWQQIVYVDGGFDLFSSGHIEFLQLTIKEIESRERENGWYSEEATAQRVKEQGEDYGPAYVIAGIHDDEVINYWKGVNYPIMNIFERGLCVLQCKYVHAVIFGAPFTPSKPYLKAIPYGQPRYVAHGPTSFMPLTYDPYLTAKTLGIFLEIRNHEFDKVNAGEIVERILKSRAIYEERQRKKGEKAAGEEAVRLREEMEREAEENERRRKFKEVDRAFGI